MKGKRSLDSERKVDWTGCKVRARFLRRVRLGDKEVDADRKGVGW